MSGCYQNHWVYPNFYTTPELGILGANRITRKETQNWEDSAQIRMVGSFYFSLKHGQHYARSIFVNINNRKVKMFLINVINVLFINDIKNF